MTRRKHVERTTPAAGPSGELPPQRRRPLAFWVAVAGVAAMLVATFGSLLSAFL